MKLTPKSKPAPAHRHLHRLVYQCPECFISTVVKGYLLLPKPSGGSIYPKPILRLESYNLACHHGHIPDPVIHTWFTGILESFNFEKGYTFINESGETKHFPPL